MAGRRGRGGGGGGRAPRARLEFHPLTQDRWDDLVALFGPNGACAGCWCMWWRVSAREFNAGKGAGNRAALRRLARSGEPPGILAYEGGRPVGWCAVGPREAFPRLDGSRLLKRVDDEPVWCVPCLFVARERRRQGVSAALVRAAVRYVASRGGRVVEAYPKDAAGEQADAFVWTGLASTFRAAGFVEVARRSPTRPIMRARTRRR
jgi:GNAT superfamily N-acetyltransferase